MQQHKQLPKTRQELIADPEHYKYMYEGYIKGVLSAWHPAEIKEGAYTYFSALQYIAAQKALCFGDTESYRKIYSTREPEIIHRMINNIKGFDGDKWRKIQGDLRHKAHLLKFQQNPNMAKVLLDTQDKILVECNSANKTQGAGIDMMDPRLNQPESWPGLNRGGFNLMLVREELKRGESIA